MVTVIREDSELHLSLLLLLIIIILSSLKMQEVLLLCAKNCALISLIHLLECPITLVMFSVPLLFVFLINSKHILPNILTALM